MYGYIHAGLQKVVVDAVHEPLFLGLLSKLFDLVLDALLPSTVHLLVYNLLTAFKNADLPEAFAQEKPRANNHGDAYPRAAEKKHGDHRPDDDQNDGFLGHVRIDPCSR